MSDFGVIYNPLYKLFGNDITKFRQINATIKAKADDEVVNAM